MTFIDMIHFEFGSDCTQSIPSKVKTWKVHPDSPEVKTAREPDHRSAAK